MILLTDLVVDGLDLDCHSIDWTAHVPLMLHVIFMGLDNNREIVHRSDIETFIRHIDNRFSLGGSF